MAFCNNCGQQLAEGTAFCPNCGAPAAAPQQPQQAQQAQQQPYGAPQQPYGTPYTDPDVQANKGISVLSYFGILLLIPMLARKTSGYCRFHVKQGATLFCAELAFTLVSQILLAISRAVFPGHFSYYYVYVPSGVTTALNVIFTFGDIFLFVLAIIGIVNAAGGKKKELPIIGKLPWIADLLDKIYYNK